MSSRAGILLLLILAVPLPAAAQRTRQFHVRYSATITDIPAQSKSLRIWMPYPESDAWQTISNLSVQAPYQHSVRHDAEYGNGILYLEADSPAPESVTVDVDFDVERREYVNRPDGPHPPEVADGKPQLMERFRKPDQLVPLTGRIAEVAHTATEGRDTPRDRARAIYDYVTSQLHYDKSGTGWGRGDAVWACDAKRGNCTDFHSLLIGMARSIGIPAKFEIGLPLPEDKAEGTIGGYHCWAAMYLDGVGWVPVDSSEASKSPAKRDYFFGALDDNRVRLSIGRDILLDPPQAGPRINYFVYPYAEIDGKPFTGVSQSFSFRTTAQTAQPK
jgi:transglutaminase-like putative cysteine protease